ncbi:MAG: hemin uptake protein HemP [Sedimentisphaerales bacterium]|nr:hemin uptake protein HemP [Sedimentisphaerales bacterium]NLZ04645.1 hemin uptake protein HemP [Phycisphaerae bacterium]HNY80697.1 hemin uptake protein HemP [Sedimentisphaerales bacterium]HOC64361.1 hemin uptake protein HemP [Sedimentisphaerales bacterium]HOH66676.1 hemin uptake protein HemP [Sedimentisphaerales bacterium]
MERLVSDEQSEVLSRNQISANCIDSQAILGDRDEVLIRHGDQVYRLRKTRHGKLILNK